MRLGPWLLLLPFALAACGTAPPTTGINAYGVRTTLSCVPYARAVSGIDLDGNAWTWWDQAPGRYARASVPEIGAVLVLRRHGTMNEGHLAVVTGIVDAREITVTQSNWLPGRIEHGQPVFDVSPANDWTLVRIWYPPSRALGITAYPADGFILPNEPRSHAALAQLETRRASRY